MISSCVEYVLCNESFRYLQQKIFFISGTAFRIKVNVFSSHPSSN